MDDSANLTIILDQVSFVLCDYAPMCSGSFGANDAQFLI